MFLVTGATGNVGAEVVRALTAAGARVRALVRDPAAATLPSGAEPVTGDLNKPDTLNGALSGARGMFLLPGYDDMPSLLNNARRAGLERVVLLSGGSAGGGDMTNAVSRYMILSENAVRESGLSWTILRPSAFMSNALRWLPQMKSGDVIRVPFPNVPAATVDPYDIAAVVAQALLTDGHRGRIHQPTGPEALLPADQVALLGKVLDRELRCHGLSDDQARQEMAATMPTEYVDAFFRFYVDGELDESVVRPTVQDVTGRPPRTFEQWATAHADDFR